MDRLQRYTIATHGPPLPKAKIVVIFLWRVELTRIPRLWFGAICLVSMGFTTVCWGQVEAITSARYDLALAFTVDGKVISVPVKPGDRVEKGQLLIQLDDQEGQSLINLYTLRANSDLAARSAEAALRLARVEEKAIRAAFEKDAATPIEIERTQIRTEQAALELDLAQQRGREAIQQLAQAQALHDQYSLSAPISGVVDAVGIAQGETVERLKPVLRLVVIDPLWIDAAVPIQQTLSLKPGDHASVVSTLPGFDQPIHGRIIHLAQVADAASGTRIVRIEVPNQAAMPAGGQVLVTFGSTPSAPLTGTDLGPVTATPPQEARP